LDSANVLISRPSPIIASESRDPTRNPLSKEVRTTPTPRPRYQTYGTATTKAASHNVTAATPLPMTTEGRGIGASRRASRVPRSRSPLIASAEASSPSSAPIATATWSVRLTASRCSRKLSASLVAVRYVVTLSTTA
jgi:hypothetical protein